MTIIMENFKDKTAYLPDLFLKETGKIYIINRELNHPQLYKENEDFKKWLLNEWSTKDMFIDNYKQFIELVKLLNKNKTIDDKKINDLNELIPFLKGKISYYSSDDRSDFPNVKYKQELIPLSQEQFKKTLSILKYTKNIATKRNYFQDFQVKI
jgi:uncharacterized protein YydD (DUF2326 family)